MWEDNGEGKPVLRVNPEDMVVGVVAALDRSGRGVTKRRIKGAVRWLGEGQLTTALEGGLSRGLLKILAKDRYIVQLEPFFSSPPGESKRRHSVQIPQQGAFLADISELYGL